MANLIITVIAIALVAIAALMGAYYGGAAFLNSEQAANASTVMNEAAAINGAWQAYLVDNNVQVPSTDGVHPDAGALVTKNYLSHWPKFPSGVGSDQGSYLILQMMGTSHYYAVAVIGTAAGTPSVNDTAAAGCVRIIKTALGSSPTTMPPIDLPTLVLGGANYGTPTFGCGAVNVIGGYSILPNSVNPDVPNPYATTYVAYYFLS